MEQRLFVGRREQLDQLARVFRGAAQGHGAFSFVEGEAGMGKTELLEAARRLADQDPELKKAYFATGYCYEDTSEQNAYQPLVEILGALSQGDTKGGNLSRFILSVIKETGPDWLAVIPGVGPAITAGIKTAVLAGQWYLNSSSDRTSQAAGMAAEYANTILKIAGRFQPLVLIIEDAHWIDEPSALLLQRLAHALRSAPLVILLTYRPSFISEEHPLRKLQRTALSQNLSNTISLAGLSDQDMQEYVLERFGNPLSPNLAAWLTQLCAGNPLFVSQYLSLLEQNGTVRLEDGVFSLTEKIEQVDGEWRTGNLPIPKAVEDLLDERINRLIKEDQTMLQDAAVLGEDFMSSVLSELLQVDELQLLPRLRAIVEHHHLLRYGAASPGAWESTAELYSFEHVLLHRVFYRKLSPRERVLYHRRVASILERLTHEYTNPPRKLILEIARHYDLGEQAPQAAQYYFLVAQSSFTSGAFKEAAQLCRRALDCIHRSRERNVDQDRITVQAVLLLLTAMDTNRQGKANEDESFSLEKLAQEGVEAAARTGDKDMLAQAQFALGRVFVATRSLSSVIEALEAALKTARESDDRQIEFAILAQLGIMVKAQSFDKGQQLVQEALKIYQDHLAPSPGQKAPLALERHFLRMQAFLGIGEFDHGNLDEAERWLAQSVAGMSRLGLNDDLLFTYNYLAQVYAGMGQFEAAEKSLQDAVRFLKDDPEPNPWRAYDSSFLGKLYLEWKRVEQAAKPILEGWKETNAKWNVDLARFPRIYYAELLIHPEYSGCDLKEARLQLEKAIEENISAGYRDMEIQARSLLARLELRSGNIARAENLSLEAVQILEKEGPWFPALRPEEVYYVHSLVMDRAGKHDEASQALEKAKAYVLGKAATLANPVHRQTFLERIPLNTAILLASP